MLTNNRTWGKKRGRVVICKKKKRKGRSEGERRNRCKEEKKKRVFGRKE